MVKFNTGFNQPYFNYNTRFTSGANPNFPTVETNNDSPDTDSFIRTGSTNKTQGVEIPEDYYEPETKKDNIFKRFGNWVKSLFRRNKTT